LIGRVSRRVLGVGARRHVSIKQRFVDDLDGAPSGVGIALSGGGVRSAVFNLGVLQVLDKRGVLSTARWLSAVSGGSYIAGAYWATAAMSDTTAFDDEAPWAPGSPEERYFRNSTNYLAPGVTGAIWFFLNVVYGLFFNYLPIVLGLGVCGRVLGWMYSAGLAPDLNRDGSTSPAWIEARTVALSLGILVSIAIAAIYIRRTAEKDGGRRGAFAGSIERFVQYLWAVFILVGIIAVLGPWLVTAYRGYLEVMFEWLDGGSVDVQNVELRIVSALLLLGIFVVLGLLSLAVNSLGRLRYLANVLGFVSGLVIIVGPAVAAAELSSRAGLNETADLVETGAMVLLLGWCGVVLHNGRYSMHLLYKERLQSAYMLKRTSALRPAEPLPWSSPIYLTKVESRIRERGVKLPSLVIGASVGLNDSNVPRGRFAAAFAFTAENSGGPLVGLRSTSLYETAGGKMELTLPAMMAISGAAVSPFMGRLTRMQFRALYAILNFRLGVWLPNPSHPYADELVKLRQKQRRAKRDGLRKLPLRFLTWARIGWYEPGALYVLREAFGLSSTRLRFVHVADGGHLDNLGLVELARRRCSKIVCFDATAAQGPLTADLARTASILRSELDCELRFTHRELEELEDGRGQSPCIRGELIYPDGETVPVIYVRAAVSSTTGLDARLLAARDSTFPYTSTLDQFFDDQEFEAYRTLGQELGAEAARQLAVSTQTGQPEKGRPYLAYYLRVH